MGIQLKVEREPEDPRRLAGDLAEAIMSASAHQVEAEAYTAAAKAERTKAVALRITINQVKEARRKGPPLGSKPRRMDPIAEYDLEAMDGQHKSFMDRADEFRAMADKHLHSATDQRARARTIERKITELRKNGRPQ